MQRWRQCNNCGFKVFLMFPPPPHSLDLALCDLTSSANIKAVACSSLMMRLTNKANLGSRAVEKLLVPRNEEAAETKQDVHRLTWRQCGEVIWLLRSFPPLQILDCMLPLLLYSLSYVRREVVSFSYTNITNIMICSLLAFFQTKKKKEHMIRVKKVLVHMISMWMSSHVHGADN